MADVLALVREATTSGSAGSLRAALEGGAAVNPSPGAPSTPLLCAVQAQNAELVDVLLRAGADPSAPDRKGVQPLHLAAFFGDVALLRLLAGAGADVNGRDRHGQTALFFAASRETCAELLQANVNPNLVNKKGQTALHLAAAAGLTEVVQWLSQHMNAGLLNVQDKHGRTAYYCSTKSDHSAALAALMQKSGVSTKLQPHKVWRSRPAAMRVEPPSSSMAPLADVLQRASGGAEAKAAAPPRDLEGPAASTTLARLLELERQAAEVGGGDAEPPRVPMEPATERTQVERLQDLECAAAALAGGEEGIKAPLMEARLDEPVAKEAPPLPDAAQVAREVPPAEPQREEPAPKEVPPLPEAAALTQEVALVEAQPEEPSANEARPPPPEAVPVEHEAPLVEPQPEEPIPKEAPPLPEAAPLAQEALLDESQPEEPATKEAPPLPEAAPPAQEVPPAELGPEAPVAKDSPPVPEAAPLAQEVPLAEAQPDEPAAKEAPPPPEAATVEQESPSVSASEALVVEAGEAEAWAKEAREEEESQQAAADAETPPRVEETHGISELLALGCGAQPTLFGRTMDVEVVSPTGGALADPVEPAELDFSNALGCSEQPTLFGGTVDAEVVSLTGGAWADPAEPAELDVQEAGGPNLSQTLDFKGSDAGVSGLGVSGEPLLKEVPRGAHLSQTEVFDTLDDAADDEVLGQGGMEGFEGVSPGRSALKHSLSRDGLGSLGSPQRVAFDWSEQLGDARPGTAMTEMSQVSLPVSVYSDGTDEAVCELLSRVQEDLPSPAPTAPPTPACPPAAASMLEDVLDDGTEDDAKQNHFPSEADVVTKQAADEAEQIVSGDQADAEAAAHKAEDEAAPRAEAGEHEADRKCLQTEEEEEEEEVERQRVEAEAAKTVAEEQEAERLRVEAAAAAAKKRAEEKQEEEKQAEMQRVEAEVAAARKRAEDEEEEKQAEMQRVEATAAAAKKRTEEEQGEEVGKEKAEMQRVEAEAEAAKQMVEEENTDKKRLEQEAVAAREKAEEDEAQRKRVEQDAQVARKKPDGQVVGRKHVEEEAEAATQKANKENAARQHVEDATESARKKPEEDEGEGARLQEGADSAMEAAEAGGALLVARFDFDPSVLESWPFENDAPLAFKSGQRILVKRFSDELPAGWTYGALEAEPTTRGFFPTNYTAAAEAEDAKDTVSLTKTCPAVVQARERKVKLVVALWAFDASGLTWLFENFRPLVFEEDDRIQTVEPPEDIPAGWSYGYIKGEPQTTGLFPANYTTAAEDEQDVEGEPGADTKGPGTPAVVVALFDFDASHVDLGSADRPALSLVEGERYQLLPEEEPDGGWILGHREGRPEEWGYFPENYVEAAGVVDAPTSQELGTLTQELSTEEVPVSRCPTQDATLVNPLGALPKYRASPPARTTPVPKMEHAGLLCWVVRLEKEHPADGLGFSYSSGAAAFARQRLGLGCSGAGASEGPQVLLVRRVSGRGMLAAWSEEHPDAAVHPTDRIYGVNNARTIQDMQHEMRSKPLLELHVARYPDRFPVSVELGAGCAGLKGLGLQLRSTMAEGAHAATDGALTTRRELTIAWVGPGAVESQNLASIREGLFHQVASRGMKIEAVNEAAGTAAELRRALGEASGKVTLWLRRGEMARAAFHKVRMRALMARQWRMLPKQPGRPEQPPAVADGAEPEEPVPECSRLRRKELQVDSLERSFAGLPRGTASLPLPLQIGCTSSTWTPSEVGTLHVDGITPVPEEVPGVDIFPEGAIVMVVNLLARPEQNGVLATVVTWQEEQQRYVIRPEGSESCVRIKSSNLVLVEVLPGQVSEQAHGEYWQRAHQVQTQAKQRELSRQASAQRDVLSSESEERERRDEEDWRQAMAQLRLRNVARSWKSQEDFDIAMSTMAFQGECEEWEAKLAKKKGGKFGFLYTSSQQEYLDARGKRNIKDGEGPRTLRVKDLGSGGAVEAYNKENPSHQIMRFDRIVEVNGKTQTADMQQELRCESTLHMKLKRYPEHFFADLQRGVAEGGIAVPPASFTGVTCERTSGACELQVKKVAPDGLVEHWNKRQISKGAYQFVVLPGMFIEAVGDREGDFEAMEQALAAGTARRLRIRRGEKPLPLRPSKSKFSSTLSAIKAFAGRSKSSSAGSAGKG